MAYEIRELIQLNDGTVKKPVYEIFDGFGSTAWNVDRCTFLLKHSRTGTVVAQGDSVNPGECLINNDDEDRAGNSIKTIRPTIDLRGTDTDPGSYLLSFHVFFDTGEDDVIRGPVKIVDYEGV